MYILKHGEIGTPYAIACYILGDEVALKPEIANQEVLYTQWQKFSTEKACTGCKKFQELHARVSGNALRRYCFERFNAAIAYPLFTRMSADSWRTYAEGIADKAKDWEEAITMIRNAFVECSPSSSTVLFSDQLRDMLALWAYFNPVYKQGQAQSRLSSGAELLIPAPMSSAWIWNRATESDLLAVMRRRSYQCAKRPGTESRNYREKGENASIDVVNAVIADFMALVHTPRKLLNELRASQMIRNRRAFVAKSTT